MPLRAALLAVEIQRVEEDENDGNAGQEVSGLDIHLEEKQVTNAIRDALEERVFADVVVLERADKAGVAPAVVAPLGEPARPGRDANVLVECSIKVPRHFDCEINEKFWLNLPLFLIGGPFSWLVDDRSYRAPMKLSVTVHNLDPIRDGKATLLDRRAQLSRIDLPLEEVRLDLVDRAGPLTYFASLLVPPAYLAARSSRARESCGKQLGEAFADQAARQILLQRETILAGTGTTDILLDEGYRVTSASGTVCLEGTAVLRLGQARRLESYRVRLGPHVVEKEFGAGHPDALRSDSRSAYVQFPFRTELPAAAGDRALELEIRAAGRDRQRRTFCIPLPP